MTTRMQLNDREQEIFEQIRTEHDPAKFQALRRQWNRVCDNILNTRPFRDRAKELEMLTRINKNDACIQLLEGAIKLEQQQQAKAAK